MIMSARWVLLAAATLVLYGCIYVGDWGDSHAFQEDFHHTYPLDPGGRVSVESFNGSIEVVGWDQNFVEVNATKYAHIKSYLEEIKIDVNASQGSVRVRAVRPGDFFHSLGVRFSIRVPRKVVLELASTSNGKIEVDSLEGNARLRTSNGGIRAVRMKGNLEAQTSNGNIDTEDCRGNASLHTSNGSVRADAAGGSFEANTSNGRIVARLSDLDSSSPVRVRSSNGHIELSLEGKQLPEVRAATSNSFILLRLPASANARVRAYTSHSSVTSEFDELRSENGRRRSELEGSIGRGGALLDLETSNGSIRIAKL